MKAGWQKKRLSEIADVQSGGTPLISNKAYWNGDIPWYSSGELNNIYTSAPERHITKAGLDSSNAKLFPVGSLLIGMYDTAALKMSILDRAGAFNQAIAGVRPNAQIDLVFVLHAINVIRESVLGQRRGVRQKNLSLGKIRDIELSLPPLPEQQRIVRILDEAFESIATAKANAEKNLQNARALFESHLQAVFSQGGEGWVEELIGSACDVRHGFAFEGGEFSSNVPAGNPLVITPGNFTEDGKLLFNDRNTKRSSRKPPTGFLFDVGDLVVVMTDLSSKMKILGKPAFVETDNVLHNQRIGRIVFLNDRIEKRFLYYFMMSEKFLKSIKRSATGTMVKHTAPKRILSNIIPFPLDPKEQRAIISKLDALREETQRLTSIYQRKLAALEALKKSLLHQAFNGEL